MKIWCSYFFLNQQRCLFTFIFELVWSSEAQASTRICLWNSASLKVISLTYHQHINIDFDYFHIFMWPSILFNTSPSHLEKRIQGQPDQNRKYHQLLFRANLTGNLTSNNNDQVTVSEQWGNKRPETTLPNPTTVFSLPAQSMESTKPGHTEVEEYMLAP